MKNLFTIIAILFSISMSFSQNDFETRYYTINANSLIIPPSIKSVIDEMPDKINTSFTLGEAPSYQNTLNTNAISTSNYWQSVDIAMAMASNTVAYNNDQELVTKDDKDMLAVNYQGLVPVLINALKEQDDKISRLEKLVEKLISDN